MGKRVLLVDDSICSVEMMCDFLGEVPLIKCSYETDPNRAIRSIRMGKEYDLIVWDYKYDEGNLAEIFDRNEFACSIPSIILTGWYQSQIFEDINPVMNLLELFDKPINIDLFARCVMQYLYPNHHYDFVSGVLSPCSLEVVP